MKLRVPGLALTALVAWLPLTSQANQAAPEFHAMARTSSNAKSERVPRTTAPTPVHTEMRASKGADGKVVLDCKEVHDHALHARLRQEQAR